MKIKYEWTGKYRSPKKGESYLGSILQPCTANVVSRCSKRNAAVRNAAATTGAGKTGAYSVTIPNVTTLVIMRSLMLERLSMSSPKVKCHLCDNRAKRLCADCRKPVCQKHEARTVCEKCRRDEEWEAIHGESR